jgi:hypothetical protein
MADCGAHTIIHISHTGLKRLPGEVNEIKKRVSVDKASQYQKLVEASRINFSRVHTVVWNVKVMNVGRMSRGSIPYLMTYWQYVNKQPLPLVIGTITHSAVNVTGNEIDLNSTSRLN